MVVEELKVVEIINLLIKKKWLQCFSVNFVLVNSKNSVPKLDNSKIAKIVGQYQLKSVEIVVMNFFKFYINFYFFVK